MNELKKYYRFFLIFLENKIFQNIILKFVEKYNIFKKYLLIQKT